MKTLEDRIRRVVREDVAIVPDDSRWPELFLREPTEKMVPRSMRGSSNATRLVASAPIYANQSEPT